MEVVVEFLEGNPDRPMITGWSTTRPRRSPTRCRARRPRASFKTNSSPGGNGFNELRFEDKAGSEEVFFQAQKDYNKKVLNNETVTHHEGHHDDGQDGNRSVTVSKGNDSRRSRRATAA